MSTINRTVTTQAVRFVRLRPSDQLSVSNGTWEPTARQDLDVKQLVEILKQGQILGQLEVDEQRFIEIGKKRTAPDLTRPRKRPKVGLRASSPFLAQTAPEVNTVAKTVQVYTHILELRYTRLCEDALTSNNCFVDDKLASEIGWLQEETELIDTLAINSEGTNVPHVFDLGEVTIGEHRGVLQLFHESYSADNKLPFDRHLLTLPTVAFSNGSSPGDVLFTCWSLQNSGHVSMSSSASLIYIPGISTPNLPIQINVTIFVSIVIPNIFHPQAFRVASRTSIEDKRRRFLSHVICPRLHEGFSTQDNAEEMSIRYFYSILEPARPVSSIIYDALQPEDLRAVLLPFQRRSVKWLLERESKTIDPTGCIVENTEAPDDLPLFWEKVKVKLPTTTTVNGKEKSSAWSADNVHWWYYNRLTGALKEDKPSGAHVAGAMLCEEMGLGKTLECLALILLSPATDRDPSTMRWDANTELQTNLIVTPTTLSQQWLDEISRHASSLKVLFYNGYRKVKFPIPHRNNEEGAPDLHYTWCRFLHEFDVVVTTYKTLQEELGVAKAPIIRPKRQAASYSHVEKPRSPLVRVEWARVFMDEVQLVGGGKTAEMVSLIPRKVSIAVSGTPARSKVSDLAHVLIFLRVNEVVGSNKTWHRLLQPEFQDLFADLFRKYAIRTLKSSVKDELTIPPQRRFAIGIELGKVERHIYDQRLQDALDELGVDARGVATSEGWEIDISGLRTWLRRLRQICIHPQVGFLQSHKSALKGPGATTIKTMQEVLQDLQSKNWQSLSTDRRSKIQQRLRRAQLMQKVEEDLNRYQNSRDLLLDIQTETEQLVEDIKAAIAAHEEQGRQIKEATAVRRRERRQDTEDATSSKGKGKARDTVEPLMNEDSEVSELPDTRVEEEYRSRRRNLIGRLREAYVLQHKVAFLLGDVYHVLGPSHSQAEDSSYAAAEAIRKSILKASNETAITSINQLSNTIAVSVGVRKKDLKLNPCPKGGIRSNTIMEVANDIIGLLNEQADLLWEWRARIYTLLTQNLSSSEGQADGEEYTRALDAQGEVEAYLQAYAALIADRKEGLIAERTALATHEAKETRTRGTFAARKAYDSDDEMLDQDVALQKQLAKSRHNLRNNHDSRALKRMMFSLSEIGNRADDRSEEIQIARQEGRRLRNIITDQGSVMEKLELELSSFRKVFNDRIQYFKQLQQLSDTVVEVEWEGDVRDAIKSSHIEEDSLITTVNLKRAQARHLQSLAKDREDGELEEARDCVLCRCPFQVGLITPCAHIFCERCLLEWLKCMRADCPVCRSKIKANALQRISLNQDDALAEAPNELAKAINRSAVAPNRSIRFNSLPQETLDEIQTFEAHGSYGSKITHLIRHLAYLQNHEPGTKSVVFSAWSDSLTIIEQALISNGIGCIKVDQMGKQNAAQRFKTDPSILVFLLHGERENAGLNLTCAKRVWLIEPTVNHSFEVQAISRVDRMGQTAATEVFCYYVEDTVEENILRMGAKRGFSLYVQEHSGDPIDISEFAMGPQTSPVDSPPKKVKQKGDFVEKAEDLIHILFPHLDYEQEVFVASREGSLGMEGMDVDTSQALGRPWTSNAVAGPSRLR